MILSSLFRKKAIKSKTTIKKPETKSSGKYVCQKRMPGVKLKIRRWIIFSWLHLAASSDDPAPASKRPAQRKPKETAPKKAAVTKKPAASKKKTSGIRMLTKTSETHETWYFTLDDSHL